MAITLKAKKVVTRIGDTVAQNVSLAAGWNAAYGSTTYAPVENDLVVVSYMVEATTDVAIGVNTVGYTEHSELYNNDTYDVNLSVSSKFMGATPDTTVALSSSGSASNNGFAIIEVWAGVDLTTRLDVAVGVITGINSGQPDAVAITPVTAGAKILVIGAAADAGIAAFTQPGTQLSNFLSAAGSDAAIGSGDYSWTSGAFDPVQWTGGSTTLNATRAAVTLALRPAPTPAVGGKIKVWNGTAWVEKPVKYWNGTAWVEKPVKYWNGTSWELT